jgi:hypothetical protein
VGSEESVAGELTLSCWIAKRSLSAVGLLTLKTPARSVDLPVSNVARGVVKGLRGDETDVDRVIVREIVPDVVAAFGNVAVGRDDVSHPLMTLRMKRRADDSSVILGNKEVKDRANHDIPPCLKNEDRNPKTEVRRYIFSGATAAWIFSRTTLACAA